MLSQVVETFKESRFLSVISYETYSQEDNSTRVARLKKDGKGIDKCCRTKFLSNVVCVP